jgi:hypothetical protein
MRKREQFLDMSCFKSAAKHEQLHSSAKEFCLLAAAIITVGIITTPVKKK